MSNDKLKRLEVYAKHLQERLSNPVSEKHKDRPEQLKAYLTKELTTTQRKIEDIKLTTTRT